MLFLDALQYGLTTTGSLWFPAVQFVLGGSRRIICDNEWNNKEPREVTEQKFAKSWWFTHRYIMLRLGFCKIHAEKIVF